MKQVLLSLAIIFALASCSSDESENNALQQAFSINGVWESGDYFISFDDNNFYSAYIADDFIDSGQFMFDSENMRLTCRNIYYNKQSTYTITGYKENTITLTASYTKLDGTSITKALTFHKSTKKPSAKGEYADGQYNFSTQLYWWDSEAYSFTKYMTYNTGTITSDYPLVADYPLEFFYVGVENTIYYQLFNKNTDAPVITGWNADADTGKVIAHTYMVR